MIEATLLQSVRWDLWLSRSLSSLFITGVPVCLPVSPLCSHTRLVLLFCFYWLMLFVIIYLDVLSHYPCVSTGNGSWLISRSVKALGKWKHTHTHAHTLLYHLFVHVLSVGLLFLGSVSPRSQSKPSGTQQEVLMMWGLCVLCGERSVVRWLLSVTTAAEKHRHSSCEACTHLRQRRFCASALYAYYKTWISHLPCEKCACFFFVVVPNMFCSVLTWCH